MSSQWQLVYSDVFAPKVEFIKALLAEEAIESIIMNKQDSAYKPIGYVELYVHGVDYIRAKMIVDKAI
ncbi:MAG: hypothetical protein ACXITV_04305 [Luteibaculaceae bacterium]